MFTAGPSIVLMMVVGSLAPFFSDLMGFSSSAPTSSGSSLWPPGISGIVASTCAEATGSLIPSSPLTAWTVNS
jgi:hypothetical protein